MVFACVVCDVGDSGGPLFLQDKESGEPLCLYGLVSYGSTFCGHDEAPTVASRASYYLELLRKAGNPVVTKKTPDPDRQKRRQDARQKWQEDYDDYNEEDAAEADATQDQRHIKTSNTQKLIANCLLSFLSLRILSTSLTL